MRTAAALAAFFITAVCGLYALFRTWNTEWPTQMFWASVLAVMGLASVIALLVMGRLDLREGWNRLLDPFLFRYRLRRHEFHDCDERCPICNPRR